MKLAEIITEAAELNDKQKAALEKMVKFGWKLHGQYAINDSTPGIAAVLISKENNAVLYPDGTTDRSTAQKSGKVNWRKGWRDTRDDSMKAAQDEKLERLIRMMREFVRNINAGKSNAGLYDRAKKGL